MAREYYSRFNCAADGCNEYSRFADVTRKDQEQTYRNYGNGKWRCVRHSREEEVLSVSNHLRIFEIASEAKSSGIYWGNMGFTHGPGFKAFAEDFPVGTVLKVTAEIILPAEAANTAPQKTPPASV